MINKLVVFFFGLFVIANTYAQQNLNAYKYIIVPKKFDFLKTENQYRLNELGQFLFNKHGFTALMEGAEYPLDLKLNRCLALRSNVFKDKNLFNTKLTLKLKDCNDKVVYTSKVGESREKEYKTAYNLALRDAFSSLKTIAYTYQPAKEDAVLEKTTDVLASKDEELEKLKQELVTLKQNVNTTVTDVKTDVNEGSAQGKDVLYAQAITNGFQLVDSSPKVVYRIKKTHLNAVFVVEGKSAIVYKNGAAWVIEYYSGDVLKQDVLNVKF